MIIFRYLIFFIKEIWWTLFSPIHHLRVIWRVLRRRREVKRDGYIFQLDISNLRLRRMPWILSVYPILMLDASGNRFSRLPKFFKRQKKMVALCLSNNRFTEIPTLLFEMEALGTLFISYNKIKEIPIEILNSTSLQSLFIGSNELEEIPDFIGNIICNFENGFTNLDVSDNPKIKILPESIGNLVDLQGLYLWGTSITELPKSLLNIKMVTDPNFIYPIPEMGRLMRKNEFRFKYRCYQHFMVDDKVFDLPPIAKELRMHQLIPFAIFKGEERPHYLRTFVEKEIDIFKYTDASDDYPNYNKISNQKEKMFSLAGLHLETIFFDWNEFADTDIETLLLSSNKLKVLPKGIGILKTLKTLDLSNNELTHLPSDIGELENLETLYLSDNQLIELPSSIGQLKKLKTLYLSNNQLTTLPEKEEFPNLKSLLLSKNNFTKIPSAIQNMPSLTSLYISENKLTELPDLLSKSDKLEVLDVEHNQIEHVFDTIMPLTKLTNLNLAHNQLTALPINLCKLPKLKILNCSNNQLTTLPNAIDDLQRLESLNLEKNKIESLPDEIGNLRFLYSLDLRENRLQSFPMTLMNLKRLKYFSITRKLMPFWITPFYYNKSGKALVKYILKKEKKRRKLSS